MLNMYNGYVYEYNDGARILHDVSCSYVNTSINKIQYAKRKGDIRKERIGDCCRKEILFRYVFGSRFDGKFKHYYMDERISCELLDTLVIQRKATCYRPWDDKPGIIRIECADDYWLVELSPTDTNCMLFHGNYVKSMNSERFFKPNSSGFHRQTRNRIPFYKALQMIINYDFEKYHG